MKLINNKSIKQNHNVNILQKLVQSILYSFLGHHDQGFKKIQMIFYN